MLDFILRNTWKCKHINTEYTNIILYFSLDRFNIELGSFILGQHSTNKLVNNVIINQLIFV